MQSYKLKKVFFILLSVSFLFICGCQDDDIIRTSSGEAVDKPLNQMWDVFGRITDGAVQRWGNEPSYFEWMALKLMWSDLEADKDTLRGKLVEYPCSDNGYMWSWETEEGWPTHHSRHYGTNAKYITAVWRYYAWTGDKGFLSEVDNTSATPDFPTQKDVSKGLTVLEKTRKAMQFQIEDLHGKDGLIIISDPDTDGTVHGKPTDYWDNYLNGYKAAYVNVYFYKSLLAMASLEKHVGNNHQYEYYVELADKVKNNFNQTFWDKEKGRYIGCIDKTGRHWDFGFTFLNTEAVFYGLADDAKVKQIYSWLDGERIISSDKQFVDGRMTGSTGKDIYALGWAPRSNTRAIESVKVDGRYWWWDIDDNITVGGDKPTAAWDEHLENGGAIFYTSFYDVMSRFKYKGAADGWGRMKVILAEFKKDKLLRDPLNNVGIDWKWGITGEFPESGLVPTVAIYGLMGIDADIDSLSIIPMLPGDIEWAEGLIVYHGSKCRIRAEKAKDSYLKKLVIESEGSLEGKNFTIGSLCPETEYLMRSGNQKKKLVSDKSGYVYLDKTSDNKIILSRTKGNPK